MSPARGEQPKSTGASNPPIDMQESNAALRKMDSAIRVLETHRETMATTAEHMRIDVRDMRDRMTRVETKLDALPSKLWIGAVVAAGTSFLAVVLGLLALASHLLGKS